jgi:cell division transport system permease protein
MFLTIHRTFRESLKNFTRNGWLSIATVSILTLSLFVVSVFFIVTLAVDDVLKSVQEKVNISIYFKPDVLEVEIDDIKNSLEKFEEIKSVEYISKEKALEDFRKSNASEPVILASLDEIGDNPLLSSLVVKAHNVNQYQLISEYVEKAEFSSDISRVNYGKNKDIIDKLNSIIAVTRKIGVSLGALFTLISLLVTFNAIRITIYTHKSEIEIMRLVGASNMFIRLPFIFEGLLYGIISSIFSMLILFTSIKIITVYVPSLGPTNDLMKIYLENFWLLFGGQVALGSLLGIIGSFIAMRKYLKV